MYLLFHKTKGFWFSPPASNAAQVWHDAEVWEQFLRGGAYIGDWKEQMRRDGWRAKKCEVRIS